MALNYFANKIADKYNLRYEGIGGSVITGVYVDEISFKDKPLVGQVGIKYNLFDLLSSNHLVNFLKASKINIKNLKSFIDGLPKSQEKSTLNLKIDKILLSTDLYNMDKIQINQAKINIKNFILTPTGIDAYIDGAKFSLDANDKKAYGKLLEDFKLDSLKAKIKYIFKTRYFKAKAQGKFSSYFAKNISFDGDIVYLEDANLTYKGKIFVNSFNNIDARFKKLLKSSKIAFSGINKRIDAVFSSEYLKGNYSSKSILSSADFRLTSKEISLKEYVKNLDKNLKEVKFDFLLKSTVDYKNIDKTIVDYDVKSNFLNIDGNCTLANQVYLSTINLPKNSLIFSIDKNHLHPKNFFPLKAKIKQDGLKFDINLKNSYSKLRADYDAKSTLFSLVFDIFNAHVTASKKNRGFIYSFKTDSLAKFLNQTRQIYLSPLKNMDAKLDIKGEYENSKFSFFAKIPKFIYKYDDKKNITVKDFFGKFDFDDGLLTLKKYSFQSSLFDREIKSDCKQVSNYNFKNQKYNFAVCTNLFDANISGNTNGTLLQFQTDLIPKIFMSDTLKLDFAKFKTKFDMKSLRSKTKLEAWMTSKYANNISLNANLDYAGKNGFFYKGGVDIEKLRNMDANLSKLFENSKINFDGDLSKANIKIDSKKFYLKQFVDNLNEKFKNSKFDVSLQSRLNFNDLNSSKILYQINSNLVDVRGNYVYKTDEFNSTIRLPKNSILSTLERNLHVKQLFPIEVGGKIEKKDIKLKAKNDKLNLLARYEKQNKSVHVRLKGFGISANIEKKAQKYNYKIGINSLRETKEAISNIYELPDLRVDAQMEISGTYKNGNNLFDIQAPWFLYQYEEDKFFFIEKSFFDFSYKDKILSLKDYEAHSYILDAYRKLFSKKTSTFDFRRKPYLINANVNNQIKIKGKIAKSIKFDIKTSNFHLLEPEVDVFLDANLSYFKDANISSLSGKVYLLKGVVKYKPKKSYEINDKDIVFVNKKKAIQKKKEKRNIFVNIMTKKDLLYLQNKNRVKFNADITIYQDIGQSLKVYGYVETKSGVYFSDNKKFEIGDGRIMYDGDFLNPFLNLKAYYEREPYRITLLIGGRLGSPLINFSSTPYLSQNDILSILLFGSKFSVTSNSKNISTNQALALFGNTFAKGIVNSIGIKLDRIQLLTTKEGNIGFSVEKQLSKRLSVIYQNDLIQSIKMKYKNTKHIETDLTFSPNSSGIEILYK